MSPIFLLLAACTGNTVPDGETDDTTATTETDTSDEVDVDEDSSPAGIDCNDYDPTAFPGNTEVWDGRDNDCDGTIDGRGDFGGTHAVVATAWFEGVAYHFELDCPTELVRHASVLDFTIRCTPDPRDADAQRLLGSQLTIVPVDNVVSEALWFGTVSVSSSSGWQSEGDGDAMWTDVDTVYLATSLDTFSLDLEGGGSLARSDGARRGTIAPPR